MGLGWAKGKVEEPIESQWFLLNVAPSQSYLWLNSDLGQVYWIVNTHLLMSQHLTFLKESLPLQCLKHMYWVSFYFSFPNSISLLSWHVLGVSESNLVSIHLVISCAVHNSKSVSFRVPLLHAAADIYSLPNSPFLASQQSFVFSPSFLITLTSFICFFPSVIYR